MRRLKLDNGWEAQIWDPDLVVEIHEKPAPELPDPDKWKHLQYE